MGGACNTYWGGRNLRESDSLEDPGVDGRIILRWISGSGMWDMDWIEMAQARDIWWAPVNAVMNLRLP